MLVNLELVQEGYAASFRFPPNTAHEADFAHAEAAAKAAHEACGRPAGDEAGDARAGAGPRTAVTSPPSPAGEAQR